MVVKFMESLLGVGYGVKCFVCISLFNIYNCVIDVIFICFMYEVIL